MCVCAFVCKVTVSRWLLGAAGTVQPVRMPLQRSCQCLVQDPGGLQLIPVKSYYSYGVTRARGAHIWAAETWHVHVYGCGCWWCMCFGKCEGGCFGALHQTNSKWKYGWDKLKFLYKQSEYKRFLCHGWLGDGQSRTLFYARFLWRIFSICFYICVYVLCIYHGLCSSQCSVWQILLSGTMKLKLKKLKLKCINSQKGWSWGKSLSPPTSYSRIFINVTNSE